MGAYIDLLKAAQSGDTAAATVLYEQYQPLIKKLSWHDGCLLYTSPSPRD